MPSTLDGRPDNGAVMLSAGRDGNICEVDCISGEFTKIYRNDKAITSLCVDDENQFFWFGTASSTINCFRMPESRRQQWEEFADASERGGIVKDEQVIQIKGKCIKSSSSWDRIPVR